MFIIYFIVNIKKKNKCIQHGNPNVLYSTEVRSFFFLKQFRHLIIIPRAHRVFPVDGCKVHSNTFFQTAPRFSRTATCHTLTTPELSHRLSRRKGEKKNCGLSFSRCISDEIRCPTRRETGWRFDGIQFGYRDECLLIVPLRL